MARPGRRTPALVVLYLLAISIHSAFADGDSMSKWYPYRVRPPFHGGSETAVDGPTVVYPGNARFAVGREPVVPNSLRIEADRDDVFPPGYWIVHFRAPVDGRAQKFLDDVTGAVVGPDGRRLARWYIPNHAFSAFLDSWETHDVIAASELVDGLSRYHPAYKLSPALGSARLSSPGRRQRETFILNVDLLPGHSFQNVIDELERRQLAVLRRVYLPGKKTYDVHYLIVEAEPRQVVSIAHVEGVRYIQETGDGVAIYDLSGGGKLQSRTLTVDDQADSPIITAEAFPLWLVHDLQGQGQFIGVVDTAIDWNNVGTGGCEFGYPNDNIDNWGFALPELSRVFLDTVGAGGVNLKIPRADELGGAALQGVAFEHGSAVAGAALGDFYGNEDSAWWEHDVDLWEGWSPSDRSGLLGPGIAHEAQLYFTPVYENGVFRWNGPGEFEANMATTLNNMAEAGVSTTAHSLGLVEPLNTYTELSVVHDTAGFDNPSMLQCIAAGNDGFFADSLNSQAVVKNVVAVGASDDVLRPEDRAAFSSLGPAFDARIKPDVMAPGTDTAPRDGGVESLLILPESNGTTDASCPYQGSDGTSFSAPIVAGAGALIHQYFEEGRYIGSAAVVDPSAALLKAMLINAGYRLTGDNLGNGEYPNGFQGWGEPRLVDVLDFPGGARRLVVYDVPGPSGFSGPTSPAVTYAIAVNSSDERLRVTLAWTDEPGSVGMGKKLLNDLHLTVTSPGGLSYRGNVFDRMAGESITGGVADTLNNLENVMVSDPPIGTWTVRVEAAAGSYSVPQGYALVVTGDVSEDIPPVANFGAVPASGGAPLVVSFTDLSTGFVTSHDWDFGDGGTSSEESPTHAYGAMGTYTVSLTVSGPGGTDTLTRPDLIDVGAPLHILRVDDKNALAGSLFTVPVLGSSPVFLGGFSAAVSYPQDLLDGTEFTILGSVSEANGAEFAACQVHDDVGSMTIEVVMDLPPDDGHSIPAGSDQVLATLVFDVSGGFVDGDTRALEFVDGLGVPPVNNLFVDLGGNEFPPALMGGTITFLNQALFIRSDCDGTGNINIADPILLLSVLFSGAIPPSCPKACDFDDTGSLNLGDAILALQLIFQSGSAPPPPFPDPGVDPTPDTLRCG